VLCRLLFNHGSASRIALVLLTGATLARAKTPVPSVDVYFGDLHSHTSYSDGQGTPEEAYEYARDVAKLDFLAITDHDHLMGGANTSPYLKHSLYVGPGETAIIPTAQRLTENGKFVALYGQEYSSMSKGNHVNVFDTPEAIDLPAGKFDLLLEFMKGHPDSTGQVAILQLNHPALGRPGKTITPIEYGRDDFGDDAGWVRNMGSVAALIEVLNGEPASNGSDRRAPQQMEKFYLMYLQLGFHVAPTGDQDNHKPDWGTATDARTGIIAPALTKADLLAALRARHVYATEDKNLKLIFRVNGHLCGDILSSPTPPGAVKIEAHIEDTDEPDAEYTVDVFRGVVGGPIAEVVKTVTFTGNTAAGAIPGVTLDADRQFLFFRIRQKSAAGEDLSWTSPVWWESGRD